MGILDRFRVAVGQQEQAAEAAFARACRELDDDERQGRPPRHSPNQMEALMNRDVLAAREQDQRASGLYAEREAWARELSGGDLVAEEVRASRHMGRFRPRGTRMTALDRHRVLVREADRRGCELFDGMRSHPALQGRHQEREAEGRA